MFLQADNLAQLDGMQHGFFTKNGGVSTGLYSSLNCSHGSHDNPDYVTDNRNRAMLALGIADTSLFGLQQIHSNQVCHIKRGMPKDYRKGDALVTNEPGLALSVLGADCAPLLFADPVNQVIAAAHSGWKGAMEGIVDATLEAMIKLGAEREHIKAAIGPAIQRASYQVQPDFVTNLKKYPGIEVAPFICETNDLVYFDLPAFIRAGFSNSGIENVEVMHHDTFANPGQFFSYRRATHAGEKDYGRQISIIALNPNPHIETRC